MFLGLGGDASAFVPPHWPLAGSWYYAARMVLLIAASVSFAGLHLLVSGTALRDWLVNRLGEKPYSGLFSLLSLGAIVWLIRSYRVAFADRNPVYWHFGATPQHIAAPIMLFALFLAVVGMISPNPTSIGQERRLTEDAEPYGIQRVTRHPFLWGVTVWGTFHLFANGDAASIALFATFVVTALFGSASIDRKRTKRFGDVYRRYMEKTSSVPFVAMLQGRTRWVWKEIGLWRVVAVLAVFSAIVSIHPWLFGAYPLPGMAD